MLFLVNNQVVDIGDPADTADAKHSALTTVPPVRLRARDVVELGQALYFASGETGRPDRDALLALAALLADKTEANAALFVRPASAQSAADVLVRLAEVPLPTLVYLNNFQKDDAVAPRLVNDAVWTQAA